MIKYSNMPLKNVYSLIIVIGLCTTLHAQQTYQVTFTHDGKVMFGTFTTPDGDGRFPTIIINPGSGPNDRDGTILLSGGNSECLYPDLNGETLKPYKDLSDALVDSGYAVLRYDKLEFTYSPSTIGPLTFHKLWLPVESAIEYIKTRTDVDTNRIILIGHSEGSSLIPIIAHGRTDIKAMISIAGARTPFDSILAYQLVHFAELCDGDTSDAQMQASQVLEYFSYVRNGLCGLLPSLFGVPACVWADYTMATDSVAIYYNLNDLPTLFLGLGLDLNVPPAELIRFENEVHTTDDFWSIPGLTHFMTPADDPHVSMTLSDTIIYWLRQNNLATGTADIDPQDAVISIYPNPFRESINIYIQVSCIDASITIYDSFGQIVLYDDTLHHGHNQLELGSMALGSYILEIMMDGRRFIKKMVKQD
jgi:dienelactone hydrolase